MKRLILCLVLLGLVAIPAAAMAAKAVDVEIGGYTKLEMWWDSTFVGKNMNTPVSRSNDLIAHHGRFQMTAQSSRFNFKIKGPDLWGAKTGGYIEVDFDAAGDARQSASNAYAPRMRHAFFRMDFPGGTEILMGQYWGMFCNLYPETIQDGPFQFHGQATQRLAQIRVTQKFGPWTMAALMGSPYDPGDADQLGIINAYVGPTGTTATINNASGNLWGQRAAMPQFQFSVAFEKDLWGKAAFYGAPRGLYAQLAFAWQRTRYNRGYIPGVTWGQNNFLNNANLFTPAAGFTYLLGLQGDNQTLDPWVLQGQVFIPLIPTRTPNLAGTASLILQMYVGQGISLIGNGRDNDNTFFQLDGYQPGWALQQTGANTPFLLATLPQYERKLMKTWGGYLQAQYYFSNEWFLSYAYGWQKPFDMPQSRDTTLALLNAAFGGNNLNGYTYLTTQDQVKFWQEHCLTLFYRPIKAFKFGLAYSYMRTDYFQKTTVGSRITDNGDNHSVRFAGWFFF